MRVLFRFGIATAIGLAFTLIGSLAAWVSTLGFVGLRLEQYGTQSLLREVSHALADFEAKHGKLPNQLSELVEADEIHEFRERWEDGIMLDGWGQPLLYDTSGREPLVKSLGQDGEPGGWGLDRDLTHVTPEPLSSLPTFPQFVFDCPSGDTLRWSPVAGAMGFLFCFIPVSRARPNDSRSKRRRAIATQLLVTSSIAVVFAMVMAMLQNSSH